ncbi:hypothetical protein RUM43_008119 [Polyplax serrata]|uniref:Uncharacterized protein n=1 Tax=Polyplax serrata TaxID=468196 RepID=A0AAN8S8W4_POLSC
MHGNRSKDENKNVKSFDGEPDVREKIPADGNQVISPNGISKNKVLDDQNQNPRRERGAGGKTTRKLTNNKNGISWRANVRDAMCVLGEEEGGKHMPIVMKKARGRRSKRMEGYTQGPRKKKIYKMQSGKQCWNLKRYKERDTERERERETDGREDQM